ncbi:unnamed protein product [Cochlearia groenlandica]
MVQYQDLALQRSFSCDTRKINPSTSPARGFHGRSPSSSSLIPTIPEHGLFLVPCKRCSSSSSSSSSSSPSSSSRSILKLHLRFSSLLRSLINIINLPTCKFLSLPSPPSVSNNLISLVTGGSSSLGRRVTGTLYGHRKGHVTFSVQYDPRSDPVLLLDLAMSTATLVKEMSSGLVRIALECEKRQGHGTTKLFNEAKWTMYCNGRKCGYAVSRGGACRDADWRVLNTVSRVTVGAGVIPTAKKSINGGGDDVSYGGDDVSYGGELLYMRGRFERVVGSRDSEAFYMMNPDKNGGPELSIFLLRL